MRQLGHAVYAIVNYRGCRIDSSVLDSYRRMVDGLEGSCYLGVTRYGMSGRLTPDPENDCCVGRPSRTVSYGAPWQHARSPLLAGG